MSAKKASTSKTLADYLSDAAGMSEESFIGMYVFFTITKKARLTREEIEQRFTDLGLDPRFVPNVIRPADAFKKATGPEAGVSGYTLSSGLEAKVMVRHVSQDRDTITRHFIRERIDPKGKHLDYTHVGDAVFYKQGKGGNPGDERLRFALHDDRLEPAERPNVERYVAAIWQDFETYRDYLYDQPLRGMVRDYIVSLNAISVRPSGGMYFVHRTRWDVVRKLAALVEGLHEGCLLHVTPLVDLPEQRAHLTKAFEEEVEQAVTKLVSEIRERRKNGRLSDAQLADLSAELKQIQDRAMEHSRIFEVSQDKSVNALEIAHILMADVTREVYGIEERQTGT